MAKSRKLTTVAPLDPKKALKAEKVADVFVPIGKKFNLDAFNRHLTTMAKAGLDVSLYQAMGITNAIVAKVYKAPSWLDNKECIVLDYSETSMVAQWIRDEIRLIAPDVYLGKVYWNKSRLIDFALEFKS